MIEYLVGVFTGVTGVVITLVILLEIWFRRDG